MFSTTNVININRHVYLYGSIPPPEEVAEELSKWDSEWSYPNETVILHINSPGGSSSMMSAIIDRLTRIGNLYTVCEGDCMSAALFLYMLGQQRAAIPSSLFMAHGAVISSPQGAEDSVQNLHEYTAAVSALSEQLLKDYLFSPKILSKKELGELLVGKQLYFNYADATERGIVNSNIEDIPQR